MILSWHYIKRATLGFLGWISTSPGEASSERLATPIARSNSREIYPAEASGPCYRYRFYGLTGED
jgi:hypothetical protein